MTTQLSQHELGIINQLQQEGFDTSHYIPNHFYTMTGIYIGNSFSKVIVPNWFHYNNSSITTLYVYIDLSILSNDYIDDFIIDFDYKLQAFILEGDNPSFDIDRLLDRMNGIQDLTIEITTGNIQITRPPTSLTRLTNRNANAVVTNIADGLNFYGYGDVRKKTSIVIPQLPENNINIFLQGKCLTESFYTLSNLITNISIDVMHLGFNIEMWPMNLKHLDIKICYNIWYEQEHIEDSLSFGILPYGLETFSFIGRQYNYPFDMPPTLKKFSFICKTEYEYPDRFDGLPDNIDGLRVTYTSWKNIGKLPKKCKKFNYIGCPDDVFNYITKNKLFKGVAIFKKPNIPI